MSITATTYAEAADLARQLRAAYAGTDWTVTIHHPLFAGDAYRVVVG